MAHHRPNFYWDINAYLAEEARVPVTFLVGVDCMGQALNSDADANAEDLAEGTSTDIALWQLPTFTAHEMVQAHLPKEYDEKIRRDLQAERADVNLHLQSAYYYDSGSRLNSLISEGADVAEPLGKFLTKTFVGRFEDLSKIAQSHDGRPVPTTVDRLALSMKMAEEERHIQRMADRQNESLRAFFGFDKGIESSRKRKAM